MYIFYCVNTASHRFSTVLKHINTNFSQCSMSLITKLLYCTMYIIHTLHGSIFNKFPQFKQLPLSAAKYLRIAVFCLLCSDRFSANFRLRAHPPAPLSLEPFCCSVISVAFLSHCNLQSSFFCTVISRAFLLHCNFCSLSVTL